MGRAIAHEARHLYLPEHADAGLGSERADLVGPTGRHFSTDDQSDILTAIEQLEKRQGTATVVETFAMTDRGAGFPF